MRRFVAREVIPQASAFEHADEFPTAIVEQMRELGLFGITIPEEYGGLGLDLLTYIGVIEELAYGWMSLSGVINTHTMLATMLVAHGTEEQKQQWLPSLASGEKRGALSLSEPDAGTDTKSVDLQGRARRRPLRHQRHQGVGDERRAGGAGDPCRAVPPKASAPSSSRRSPGPSYQGISVSKHVGKLGYKGIETVEMSYVDHRIPASNLVGTPGARSAADPRRPRGRPDQHRGACRRGRTGRIRRRAVIRTAAHDDGQADR